MKKAFFQLCFCFVCSTLYGQSDISVSGKIVDDKGSPIVYGHIHIGNPIERFLENASAHFPFNPDGTFTIEVKNDTPLFLHFTSPNHLSYSVYLPGLNKSVAGIKISLPRHKINQGKDFQPKLVSAGGDEKNKIRVAGKKIQEGVYDFDISQTGVGAFSFNIEDASDVLVSGGVIESNIISYSYTLPVAFSLATDKYKALVNSNSAKLIRVDFNLILAKDKVTPSFITDNERITQFISLQKMAEDEFHRYIRESAEFRTANGSLEGFNSNSGPYYKKLLKVYAETTDLELKKYALAKMMYLCISDKFPVEKKYLLNVIAEIPATDYLWISDALLLNGLFKGLGDFNKGKDLLEPLLDSLIENCPIESYKANLLFFGASTAKADDETEIFNKYFESLVNNYPESVPAQNAIKRMGNKLKIIKGKALPEFSVPDIDNTGKFINNETFNGKIFLIDFWATWCVPCIAQFPNLQNAFEKYKDNGLEIISISIDKDVKSVIEFRKKRWRLPWLNGFAGDNKKLLEKFEVFAVPKMILVDKDGTILSVSRKELEDEGLDKILSVYFKE